MNPIPIFVIVKDRLTVLKQSVKSWRDLIDTPIKIIFIDNGSTYPPTIEFLKKVQGSPQCDVVWNRVGIQPGTNKTNSAQFWTGWPNIIETYINAMPKRPAHYIVSDPDIMFENISSDILEVYAYLLGYTRAVCVGPALEINDIPDYYPLKNQVLGHEHEFWQPGIETANFGSNKISYKHTRIDTTFAMYRSDYRFKRHTVNAIRVFKPYSAKHLDWYIDPNAIYDDQLYYIENCHEHGGLSHWGGAVLAKRLCLKN